MTDRPEFKRGDTVYLATYDPLEVQLPCPVCFGKRVVQVILGDDSVVETPCDYCRNGYSGPRGYVTTWDREARVEPVVIDAVVVEDGPVRKVEYRTDARAGGYRLPSPDNLFADETSAIARANVLAAEYDEWEATRHDRGGKQAVKKISWSIGYHLRNAKESRRQAEYHEARAVVLKGREKKPKAPVIDGRVGEFV